MPSVKIDTAASGQVQLIAGTSNTIIRVLGYVLMAGGTTAVKLQDGNTDLMGALPLTAQAGAVAPVNKEGWFDLTPGNALNVNNSQAIQISGHVRYALKG
jgi:hypothetical protein